VGRGGSERGEGGNEVREARRTCLPRCGGAREESGGSRCRRGSRFVDNDEPGGAAIGGGPDLEEGGLVLGILGEAHGLVGLGHRFLVEFEDDITGPETGFPRGRFLFHLGDQHAFDPFGDPVLATELGIEVGDADAIERAGIGIGRV